MKPTWTERANQKPEGNIRLAMMRGDLARLSSFFEETRNPAAAWLCWHLAEKWQLPAPLLVTQEINRFSAEIAALAIEALDGNKATVIEPAKVASFWDVSPKNSKNKSRRGKTPLAEELRLWDRNIAIAVRVHILRKSASKHDPRKKMSKDEAFEIAAEEYGISPESVDQIARKYRKDFLASELDQEV
jgi:hypothetical protein